MAIIKGNQNIANFLGASSGDIPFQVLAGGQAFGQDPQLYKILNQQQGLLPSQSSAPAKGNFFRNVIAGLADPFIRLGGVGAVGLNKLSGNTDYANELQEKMFGKDSNLLEQGLKGGVGAASWFVPGIGPAGSLANVMTKGALAGGLGALSRQDFLSGGLDVGELALGAGLGAGTSGALYGASKGIGKLLKPSKIPSLGKAGRIEPLTKVDKFIKEQTDDILRSGGDDTVIAMKLGTKLPNQRMNAIQKLYKNRLLTGNEAKEAVDDLIRGSSDDQLGLSIKQLGEQFKSGIKDSGLRMVSPVSASNTFKSNTLNKKLTKLGQQYDDVLGQLKQVDDEIGMQIGDDLGRIGRPIGNKKAIQVVQQMDDIQGQIDDIFQKPKTMIGEQDLLKVDQLKQQLGQLEKAQTAALIEGATGQGQQVGDDLLTQGNILRKKLGTLGNEISGVKSEMSQLRPKELTANLASINDDPYEVFVKKGTNRIRLDKLNPLEKKGMYESYRKLGFEPAKGKLDITGDFKKSIETIETLLKQEKLPRTIKGISELANRLGVARDNLITASQGRLIVDVDDFTNTAARKAKDLSGGFLDDSRQSINELVGDTFPEKVFMPPSGNKATMVPLKQWSSADLYDITQNPRVKDTAFKVLYGKSQANVRPDAAAKAALYDTANKILKERIPDYGSVNNAYRVLFEQNEPLRRTVKDASMRNLIQQSSLSNRIINLGEEPFWRGTEKLGRGLGLIGERFDNLSKTPGFKIGSKALQRAIPTAVGASVASNPDIRSSQSVLGVHNQNQMDLNDDRQGREMLVNPNLTAISEDNQIDSNFGFPSNQTGNPLMRQMEGSGMANLVGNQMDFSTNQVTSNQPTYFELFQAALNDTGDFNMALKLTETLAPHMGIFPPSSETQMLGTNNSKLTSSQQDSITQLKQAEAMLNSLYNRYQEVAGGTGIGVLDKMIGTGREIGANYLGTDPKLVGYENFKQGLAGPLFRALGVSGSMSDKDIQRAVGLIPSVTDTPEVAEQNMRDLLELININKSFIGQSSQNPLGSQQSQTVMAPEEFAFLSSAYY